MNRKTSIAVAIAGASLVLTACGSEATTDDLNTATAVQESTTAEVELETPAEVEPSQEVAVDGTSLTTVTYPREFIGDVSEKELKSDAEADGWDTEATLNSDGSVTYTMTQNEFQRILDGYRQVIDETIESQIAENPLLYESVTYTDDFSEFEVLADPSQEMLFFPRLLSTELADKAFVLRLFSGVASEDNYTVVNTIDSVTGELIDTFDSRVFQ
jgi:hypothetical protein